MEFTSLDDMLCFSLYSAARAVTKAYRTVLTDSDLTYPQFLVLLSLKHSRDTTVSELGEVMRLDSGTLSPLLRRLEARELLTRVRRDHDERVVTVSITDAGRTILSDVTEEVNCLAEAYGIDREEIGDLIDKLHRISSNMSELTTSRRTPALS